MSKTSGVRIELEGLSFRYGGETALDGLSLELPAGQVTALVGPSGAGKSTVLKLVAGLAHPSAGDIRFDGVSVLPLPPEKRGLGVVFQSYALFPHLTVADNVAFGLTVRGLAARRARARVGEVLERLEIAALADRLPHQLSGGERQRVALARALAVEPRALLLDEPLAALDARLRLALRAELGERLRSSGRTALYITHDQEEAMALGDRVAVLRRGRLEQVGTPEELYRRPASPFVATFVGEANFLPVRWDPAAGRLSGPWGDWAPDPATAERFNGVRQGRLLVRPEAFRPTHADTAHLSGTVAAAAFLGGRRRLRLVSSTGELLVDLPASLPAGAVAPGEVLALAIDFRSTVLLPDFDPEDYALARRAAEGAAAAGERKDAP
jgi:ABC-type Fe3+/spermidine/putrescine transport system ATPase subunit